MAVLALGLAGAALAPAGYAAIGWTAGTILGQVLFTEKQRSLNEGPRLSDLRVQASSYGVGIARVYGTVKIAGNLIWTSGITESVTESTEEVGKGGGAEVTNRTYTYFASFAIGVAAGPIVGVRRIWADGELIYDANNSDPNTLAATGALNAQLTVYTGTETQLADPEIEAHLGAGNVPAHRGLAYAVWKQLDITRWGRIPSFEFEIVAGGNAVPPPTTLLTATGDITGARQVYEEGGLVYGSSSTVTGSTTTTYYVCTPDYKVVSRYTWANTTYSPSFIGVNIVAGNVLGLLCNLQGANNDWYRVKADGTVEVQTFAMPGFEPFAGSWGGLIAGFRIGDTVLVAHWSTTTTRYLQFLRWDEAKGLPQSAPFKTITQACASTNEARYIGVSVAEGHFWVLRSHAGTTQRGLDKYDVDGNLVDSWDWNAATVDAVRTNGFCLRNNVVFLEDDGFGSSRGRMLRIYPGGAYEVISAGHSVAVSGDVPAVAFPGLAWGTFKTGLLVGQVSSTAPTLASVVGNLCQLAGLTAGELDTIALTDGVRGYVVGRPMTARAALEPLAKAFAFDVVESDQKLKFVKRGGASAATIPAEDLGAGEPGGEPRSLVEVSRLDESEIPREVRLGFWNADGAYRQGSEAARRLVVRSVEQLFEDLPLVLTPDEAARIANRLLYTAHLERMPLTWSTGPEYDKYEPTDVLTLTAPTTTYTVRVTRKTAEGQRIRWEGVLEDAGAHSGAGAGATDQDDDTVLGVAGAALLELMDIPILRDADDDAGFYAALGGVLAGWRGGVLLGSDDGVNYTQANGVNHTAAIGVATTALGGFSGGNVVDELNTVTVRLATGTVQSVTLAAMLGGANAALLGGEVIQFRTATLVSGTTFTLSGLLRGRAGTEQHMGTHVVGDRFVLLQLGAGLMRVPLAAALLGRERQYKGVSYGLPPSFAPAQAFTNTGAGARPLAPVYLRGFRNGASDLTINWVRRTRVSGEWRDYVDAALGEASEAYEVDIRNALDTATLRTLTATTPTATYTAAQQTTDFGAPQTSIIVRVYQLSATAGRGFAVSGTL